MEVPPELRQRLKDFTRRLRLLVIEQCRDKPFGLEKFVCKSHSDGCSITVTLRLTPEGIAETAAGASCEVRRFYVYAKMFDHAGGPRLQISNSYYPSEYESRSVRWITAKADGAPQLFAERFVSAFYWKFKKWKREHELNLAVQSLEEDLRENFGVLTRQDNQSNCLSASRRTKDVELELTATDSQMVECTIRALNSDGVKLISTAFKKFDLIDWNAVKEHAVVENSLLGKLDGLLEFDTPDSSEPSQI